MTLAGPASICLPLPGDFDPVEVAKIRECLDRARAGGVTVAFAIESGSRAWGFPSPDSDYDCRFVYVRPVRDHLLLDPPRDVIEFPIEGLSDAGGWDLRKALILAHGGNAVVNEWARSPLVYEEIPGFREEMAALLEEVTDPIDVANHYRGLARSQLAGLGDLTGPVKLKKVLYLVRPLLSLLWMRERDFAALPPMDIGSLRAGVAVPPAFSAGLEELLAMKKVTRELGVRHLDPSFIRHLDDMLAEVEAFGEPTRTGRRDRMAAAQDFYTRWVTRLDRTT